MIESVCRRRFDRHGVDDDGSIAIVVELWIVFGRVSFLGPCSLCRVVSGGLETAGPPRCAPG